MPTPQEMLDTQIEVSELFQIYGELLSKRQKTFVKMYYDENLSLAEIAEKHDISRQAVHDAIKHGRNALRRYEEVLHLREMKKNKQIGERDDVFKEKVRTILEEMENAINEDSTDQKSRLLAQIASLKDLVGLPRFRYIVKRKD